MGLKEEIENATLEEISEIRVRGVTDYRSFCKRLDECIDIGDLCFDERANQNTEVFLEAMSAWLRDTNGGDSFFLDKRGDCISWKDLLRLIYAATVYD